MAENAALTIHCTSPSDMQERELYESVDGAPNVILSYGDQVTIPLTPGHHRLRVHDTISRRRVEFDVAPGDHV